VIRLAKIEIDVIPSSPGSCGTHLDQEWRAIPVEVKAQANAVGGDYVDFYLGVRITRTAIGPIGSYSQDFSTKYPDSLNSRDAAIVYGNALLAAGKNPEAAKVLERNATRCALTSNSTWGALARAAIPILRRWRQPCLLRNAIE